LNLLGPAALHVFHLNDYPLQPPRAEIKDSDRIYPGDGVAPLREVFQTLDAIGFDGYLSIELFNPTYWQQDARSVARTALEKMKAVSRNR
jgi:sugar phosphate isomerase/epimerase